MRRLMLVVISLSALASFAAARAHAQQGTVSPAVAILQPYLLMSSSLPDGWTIVSQQELTNADAAASLQDPALVQGLIADGRIDGFEQDLELAGPARELVELDFALFRDSSGAEADLTAAQPATDLPSISLPSPGLGDTSVAAQFRGTTQTGGTLLGSFEGFTVDRLEVTATGEQLGGEVAPDLSSLLTPLAQLASSQPPPPPSAAELAPLQTQTAPESILHDAYTLLVENYLTPLSPSTVLGAAYAGAAAALSSAGLSNLPPAPSVSSADVEAAWQQFLPAYQQLEALSGAVSPSDLADAAAAAMYDGLNCHTQFFPAPVYSRVISELNGDGYVGIGITRSSAPPYTILKVQAGTPADQAGLRPGDEIVAVDHVSVAQAGDQAFNQILGDVPGTPITLTIQRPGEAASFDVTMVRQQITPPIEQQRILAGGIGYIELDEFDDGNQAVDGVGNALTDFEAAGNVRGWVLDLRFNNGGSSETLRRVADLLLPQGSLLATLVQRDGQSEVLRTDSTPLPDQKPLVILTGPGTASSAEIFAEALRDLGRATIVGAPTAGCVNGGEIYGLLDGSGTFVSTVRVLAGPKGVALEGAGVTPDQSVDLTATDLASGDDPQLAAAIADLSH